LSVFFAFFVPDLNKPDLYEKADHPLPLGSISVLVLSA